MTVKKILIASVLVCKTLGERSYTVGLNLDARILVIDTFLPGLQGRQCKPINLEDIETRKIF
jgi:hypothetical protein